MKLANILAAAAFLAGSFAASATTLVDGSFETKGAATPGLSDYCYDGFSAGGRPICAASPWTGGGVIVTGAGPWGGTTTPAGNYYGFVQGTSVVSQSFTATETGTGVLTWIDANRGNQGGLQSYTVSIFDGTTTTGLGTYTSALGGFVGRSTASFGLINGTSYTLSFTGLTTYIGTNDSDRTSFIDNVVLTSTAATVPEPSTWAMLIAGFGLVGFAARRRRIATAA
nr:PEPxxWA-CTERM sorting domain-containing protein [Polymorphobacter sp.]